VWHIVATLDKSLKSAIQSSTRIYPKISRLLEDLNRIIRKLLLNYSIMTVTSYTKINLMSPKPKRKSYFYATEF